METQKLSCMFLLFQLLSLYCSGCNCTRKFLHGNNNNDFYQDLTEPINQVLQQQNTSYHLVITEALKRTSLVYYATDILLADIEQIIPVIDLLQNLKEKGTAQPQLMLSLLYVNKTNGAFLWERLGDVYYDARYNMSLENQSKIVVHVAAIVLDFYGGTASQNIYRYETETAYPGRLSFVNYTKRFIKQNFWEGAIQVGVVIGVNQRISNDQKFLARYGDIDFVIYQMEFDTVRQFPVSFQEFNATLNSPLGEMTKCYYYAFGKPTDKNVNAVSKNVKMMIKMKDLKPQEYTYLSHNYWPTLFRVLAATSDYKNTSENLFLSAQQRAPIAFQQTALRWMEAQGQHQLIINSRVQNYSEYRIGADHGSGRDNLTIPHIQVKKVLMNSLELMANLSTWKAKYDAIMVDEVTWMEMKRFRSDLENGVNSNSQNVGNLTVILQMNSEYRAMWSMWNGIEVYMKKLVYDDPNFAELTLSTVVFDETDIQEQGIQKFLNFTKGQKYKIGCSLSFDTLRNYLTSGYQSTGHRADGTTFKNSLAASLCKPLFQSIDVFIWAVSDSNQYYYHGSGLLGLYADLFLTRAIFMREFPGKEVIIQFSTTYDKTALATVYNAPMVVPLHQIVF